MEGDVWLWVTRTGALAGFVAFVFRAWEFFRDRRPNLRLTWLFTTDPDVGNTLIILNSSKVGTSIYHYSLESLPKTRLNRLWRRFPKGYHHVEASSDEPVKIDVPAYGQVSMQFANDEHFNWGASRTDDLYLRLWTTSRRRPITLFVVG